MLEKHKYWYCNYGQCNGLSSLQIRSSTLLQAPRFSKLCAHHSLLPFLFSLGLLVSFAHWPPASHISNRFPCPFVWMLFSRQSFLKVSFRAPFSDLFSGNTAVCAAPTLVMEAPVLVGAGWFKAGKRLAGKQSNLLCKTTTHVVVEEETLTVVEESRVKPWLKLPCACSIHPICLSAHHTFSELQLPTVQGNIEAAATAVRGVTMTCVSVSSVFQVVQVLGLQLLFTPVSLHLPLPSRMKLVT